MFKERNRLKVLIMTLFLFGLVIFPLMKVSPSIAGATAVWTDMDIDVPIHPGIWENGAAYDSESDRIIFTGALSMETYAYDYNTNTYTNLTTPDFKREGSRMAYDSESDVIISFGGDSQPFSGHLFHNDTHAYDYNTDTLTNMTMNMTGTSPSPRGWVGLFYDSESDIIILHGGTKYTPLGEPWDEFVDTWAYDYNTNTWTEMQPANFPEKIGWAGGYDVESDRIIYFGGSDQQGEYDETWAYDYNTDTWEEMNPSIKPSIRHFHRMTYDIASDRMILFGGRNRGGYPATLQGSAYSDTWTYDYNTNKWTKLMLSNHPDGRVMHLMEYDQESDKTVIIGGVDMRYDATKRALIDTWVLDYQLNSARAPQNLQITTSGNVVNLTWQAPSDDGGSSIIGYNIYRGQISGDLSLLTQLGNVLEYSDNDITPEVTYFYAVKAVNEVGESSASEEVSTTVPARTTNSFSILLAVLAFLSYLELKKKKKKIK